MSLKKIIKKVTPKRVQPFLARTYSTFTKVWYSVAYRGSRYHCPFCDRSFSKLLPAGLDLEVLREKKVIGGGLRLNATCPWCESGDRERQIYTFIKEESLLKPRMKLLHMAPELSLQKVFEKAEIEYFSADIASPLAKFKMDILDIRFPNNFFDAVMCNHVLEHIIDDSKAMKELFRVLKPGGWALLQVPISPILEHTFEDATVTKPEDRERIFGQFDHVRLYGKDYSKRLESAGFSVQLKKLSAETTKKLGVDPNELLYFCKKA